MVPPADAIDMEAWVLDDKSKGADALLKKITVDPEAVRSALSELRELLPVEDQAPTGVLQRWRMDEVELHLEISAEGGVRLIGSATVGITGGITVKFGRRA